MKNEVLMPVNQDFLDVFDIFMDEEQKTKIRANNVRQYVEGIVDLLLKDKIKATLKPNELYEGINWGRKIKILKENYDEEIANNTTRSHAWKCSKSTAVLKAGSNAGDTTPVP